jgi:hypothetical protein
MDDIRRQDLRLYVREFFRPGRVVWGGLLTMMCWVLPFPWLLSLTFTAVIGATWALGAYRDSVRARFHSARFAQLWADAKDRYERFEAMVRKMSKERVADLREMPRTVHATALTLYVALRRADLVQREIERSERGLLDHARQLHTVPSDPQTQELYRLADRNVAEYRQGLQAVMAGVRRTEAQAAVFTSTLDTLRMRMLGHRLLTRSPEAPSQEFLEALTEAKMQLDAIDQALEELEIRPFPKLIAVLPKERAESVDRGTAP